MNRSPRSLDPRSAVLFLLFLGLLALIPVLAGAEGTAQAAVTTHGAATAAMNDSSFTEDDFLSRTRRMTYEGRRAGEGYFSPDGGKMVFQSERQADNPFYQIFLMDMATGDTTRVSNGTGKTTCPFIRPGSTEVLYGSTHHDPRSAQLQKDELDFRASGKERRYAWDYDPQMELWVTDSETGESKRLTNVLGYDAEASYSPDGEWIVYSSTRSGYANAEPTAAQKKQLEIDPAYYADLYIMRADGSGDRQLTDVPGYDGGPFFFPDGSRIVWRRFTEDGLTADVYSIKPDGTDEKRITTFGAMSWAPYVHPSGEYIFFASNKLGFTNFEVFIVDVEGEKEPVQVTYTDGFDGLPVPTPDGKKLTWTSSGRHDGDAGQIYIANWNHEKALEALAAAPPRVDNTKQNSQ